MFFMIKWFRCLPLVFVRRCLLAAGVAASTGSGWSAAAVPVTVREQDGAIALENGMVRACFEGAADGVRQRFSARNAAGEWEVVLESLHPVRSLPAGANRLYDAGVGKDRYLANTLVTRGAVLSRSDDEAVVKLTGDSQGAALTQTVRLRRGEPWFHMEVRAELPERPAKLGYQLVSRHLWERFGHPVFTGQRHLAMPFADYATTIRDVIFQPLAVQPGVPGYPDTGAFLEFELDGRRVGGFRNAAPFWLDVLGNTEFGNNVRDATGMYEWGKRLGDQSLCDRARRTIELALAAPQNPQGLFPLIYRLPNLYPVGLGPENIDHEGHPQSAMRTSPSWGEGSGVFTGLAAVLRELGGAYVDATKRLAVGVDGVRVVRAELRGSVLEVELEAGPARPAVGPRLRNFAAARRSPVRSRLPTQTQSSRTREPAGGNLVHGSAGGSRGWWYLAAVAARSSLNPFTSSPLH